jgi:hypothetical protein
MSGALNLLKEFEKKIMLWVSSGFSYDKCIENAREWDNEYHLASIMNSSRDIPGLFDYRPLIRMACDSYERNPHCFDEYLGINTGVADNVPPVDTTDTNGGNGQSDQNDTNAEGNGSQSGQDNTTDDHDDTEETL